MADKNEHLKIDLDFLDKKEAAEIGTPKAIQSDGTTDGSGIRHDSTPLTQTPISTGYKYNRKNILIVGAIILFFGWAIFSGDNGSSSSVPADTSSSNSENVATGQYMCSRSDHNYADSIDADPNNYQKTALDNRTSAIAIRSNSLDAEKASIQSEYVDETSQYSIDAHNARIDSYNIKLEQYQADVQSLQNAIDSYNAAEKPYNNYLQTHCTRQY